MSANLRMAPPAALATEAILSAGLLPRDSSDPNGKPRPDKLGMLAALAAMFDPKDVIELRAFHKGKKRTDAGYYDGDHRQDLVDAAARLNAAGAAVYVTLNKLDPQLLGRYCNRIEDFASATATDANVTRRRWLLLDFDPVRPKDTSANDMQLSAAHQKARQCATALKAEGWPEPLGGESGNGWHLYYPLDLPNDTQSRDLVKGALIGLAAKFDDDVVKVDQAVFNAGRITKLFGTVATKGDHTPLAPWRPSRLVLTPARSTVVTEGQLRALHPVQVEPQSTTRFIGNASGYGDFNLSAFLSRLGVPFEQDTHEGADRYKLAHCPFNTDHGKGEAAIFQQPGGRLGFKCQHSSCADKKWEHVRALIDGWKETRHGLQARARVPVRGLTQPGPVTLSESVHAPTEWPEALQLVAKVDPEPYPLDALPDTIRMAVAEVQGFTKAPIPMVASSALAALSLAIQAHVDVQRTEKLTGPAGLFLLTIADSGERKSTCDGFFTRATKDYEARQAEAAEPILKDHRAALHAWDAKRGGIKDKIRQLSKESKSTTSMETALRDLEHAMPKPLRIPRLLYADATPEALAFCLAKQWPSGGVVSAEAGIVFGSHGMGQDSVMRNLAMLNQLWDGNNLTIDRRTSESFTVRGARLTMALQVQEPTLRAFFARSGALARGTGFLARFLVAWPESTQGFRSFTEAPANWPHLAAFNQSIAGILEQPVPIDDDGALIPAMLTLSPEAKAAWVTFHNAIEGELASGGELYDVRDVASKAADNVVRLAALFHVFGSRNSKSSGSSIQIAEVESASRIVVWHLNESRRFFGELALPVELATAARLDAWLIAYCKRLRTHMVPTKTVQQFGPGGIREKAVIETAVRELEELGRARLAQDGRRRVIKVNPALVFEGVTA